MSDKRIKISEIKSQYEVCIIGAGFGGLISALELKKNGIHDFIIIEREPEVGGTWYYNQYPGCTCDVPSHLYSIKSEPKYKWQYRFGKQSEILNYIKHCFYKNRLIEKTAFNCKVKKTHFEEQSGLWNISLGDNLETTFQSRFIISATGPLNEPKIPFIQNMSTFEGIQFHSMRWDHKIDLKNKNIVVIGTGASSIQFIPIIAKEAKSIHVIQRTAPWILPKQDKKYNKFESKLFDRVPIVQRLSRNFYFYFREIFLFGFLGKNGILKLLKKYSRGFLNNQIKDPELRKKLEPNFEIGCKRVLLSNDYLNSLTRKNVHLVTEGIKACTKNGITLKSETEIPADIIIYGTGFRPSSAVVKIKTTGLNGQSLIRTWLKQGPKTYHGIISSGFPNMFFIVGPNTGLANNSILLMMEAQVKFILNYIETVNSKSLSYLNVKEEAQERYYLEVQKNISSTIWNLGACKSWYLDSKGNNWALWPGFIRTYQKNTKKINLIDFSSHHKVNV